MKKETVRDVVDKFKLHKTSNNIKKTKVSVSKHHRQNEKLNKDLISLTDIEL